MRYLLTDNPAKAARWEDPKYADETAARWVGAHAEGIRPAYRVEPADDRKGYVVRVYMKGGRPVEDRIGWLCEKRVVRRRRKVVEDGD